ncbi:helix-turn-helix transcriptional regulator [Methylopila sp. M107]|uniref:helix-turn-helix transcriptional regulator n=1 Tax=Methylopila sp. M107 TaxID=1101190 RepID=UPI000362E004|nr:helix-turn-helix transcriptional regulator [Methylopila sp. M107]
MDLVEKIYEAAAVPECWPAVLDDISRRIGAAGGTLITVDRAAPVWVASPGVMAAVRRYFEEGWAAKNDRMEKLLRDGHSGFIRDVDIYRPDEVAELPMVKDFLRPLGYGWSAALATPVPTGEILLFSVEQHWRDGPLTDEAMHVLEQLRPHISRASLLTAKLRFERAKGAVEAFGLAAVPAALVREDASVVAANDLFCTLDRQLAIGPRDRLRLVFEGAAKALSAALARKAGRGGRRPPLSIAIPADGAAAPLVLHILPSEGAARDVFGAGTALLLVTRLDAAAAPDAGLIRALFDLTPMEARVAQTMLSGDVTSEAAAALGVAEETVRTHVKAVLRKTGFRRRVDLVRFLAGLPTYGA